MGHPRFDSEGRFLELEFPNFTLINLYLPHGGRKKENLAYKLEVYEHLISYLKNKLQHNLVVTGDFNIAHHEIDLARPKQNLHNIMFTPEERTKIDKLIHLGFIDTFREFNRRCGQYTWWPYAHNARQRNLGWRIDYTFISPALKSHLKKSSIHANVFGSDHCPIELELETNSKTSFYL